MTAETRERAGVTAGDEVEIELDLAPREVEVPVDFATGLAGDDVALRSFEALSYSNKRRLVIPVEAAKAAETRLRRIEKTVAALREAKATSWAWTGWPTSRINAG